MKLLLGTWYSFGELFETEIVHALEVSESANVIHENTVSGIIFSSSHVSNKEKGNEIEQIISKYRPRANASNIGVGIRYSRCGEFKSGNNSEAWNILLVSDFIVCIFYLTEDIYKSGPIQASKTVGKIFSEWKKWVHEINGNVTVYGESGPWASEGFIWNNVQNMKEYWNAMSAWAQKNEFVVFMGGAFDNPLKEDERDSLHRASAPHEGWWRLRSNEDISVTGFVEKITGILCIPYLFPSF